MVKIRFRGGDSRLHLGEIPVRIVNSRSRQVDYCFHFHEKGNRLRNLRRLL